ncbi:MAG: hypothetical protein PHT33_10380 [bacterium]|nr:hypothetical protein [bacterium]
MRKHTLVGLIGSIILLCCLSIGYAYADCIACFELKGVKVELKNGKIASGYVAWNSAWFEAEGYKPKSPYALVDSKEANRRKQPLVLYKKLYSIEKPFRKLHGECKPGTVLVTSEADTVKLPLAEIRHIKAKPMKYDGYTGAGNIPRYSKKALEMLINAEPVAVIVEDTGVSDDYYISYNQAISEKELKKRREDVNNGLLGEKWTETVKKLEKDRIVTLSIGYD